MAEKVQRIVNIINQIAPPRLAEHWDNVGLIIGDYAAEVERVMVSLDVTEAVLDQAINEGIQLIISHHPMIFKELKAIRFDQPVGRLIIKAIQNGVNIFAAHTNLDITNGGLNDLLADRLGVVELKPLTDITSEQLYKIVVFIPEGHQEMVRQAMCDAGAGWIGNYSDCTFQTAGTGTFKPLTGANPFIGQVGELEKTKEVRLETIVPASLLSKVLKVMLKNHPYEEVAYDIYLLANQGAESGLGRIGYLREPMSYMEFISVIKNALDAPYLRYTGDLQKIIRKVALCSGSGSNYINQAAFKGADVYITGDVDFHKAQLAESLGVAVVDAGHYWTEVIAVPYLFNLLQEEVQKQSMSVELVQSTLLTDPMFLYK